VNQSRDHSQNASGCIVMSEPTLSLQGISAPAQTHSRTPTHLSTVPTTAAVEGSPCPPVCPWLTSMPSSITRLSPSPTQRVMSSATFHTVPPSLPLILIASAVVKDLTPRRWSGAVAPAWKAWLGMPLL
jgi:hypothetical protein